MHYNISLRKLNLATNLPSDSLKLLLDFRQEVQEEGAQKDTAAETGEEGDHKLPPARRRRWLPPDTKMSWTKRRRDRKEDNKF